MNWTVQGLLDWATSFFKGKNIESPHLEAEILLAHALQCKRIDLYLRFEQAVGSEALARFKDAVIRRMNKEPVAYITGNKSFFSLEFKITPDVLIPRPETETLVEGALEFLADLKEKEPDRPLRVVDVGTGSGIIAVCLAKFFPAAHVLAIDISEAALAVARENGERHGVLERCSFALGSLLEPLANHPEYSSPDLIVSNPPYVTDEEYTHLDPGIRDYEPQGALRGGLDGFAVIRDLIHQSSEALSPGGALLVEMSPPQTGINFPWAPQRVIPDLAGQPRVAVWQK